MNRFACSLVAAACLVVLSQASGRIEASEHSYVGSKKCKMCHLKEWQSWSGTRMAKAYEALKPGASAEAKTKAGLEPGKDYTKDPTCLECHTTGHGKPGGFVDIETTPDHAGVGCETCHGPGGTYLKPEFMSLKNKEYKKSEVVQAGLVGEITVAQCTACHNTRSPFVGDDYVFDFEANKAKGTHEKIPLKYEH